MTTTERLIAEVMAAADGEIIGRIRLQKIFYLLQQSGLGHDLAYRYHHFGPYSRDLDLALGRAAVFEGVKEAIEHRKADGMPFSVFSMPTRPASQTSPTVGEMPFSRAHTLIAAMKQRSSTVLELAATIHWLIHHEKVRNWKAELVRRKGIKTAQGRDEEALDLLAEIGLPVG